MSNDSNDSNDSNNSNNYNNYNKFTKQYNDISWRYARYYLEYENKKDEYNEIKKKIFDEYVKYYINSEYSFKEANRLACIYINNSHRVYNKYNELLKIKNYKDNTEKNYNYLYDYYNCKPVNKELS